MWRVPVKTSFSRHVTTPVVVGEMVVVSSHEAGLTGVRVTRTGATWQAETAWTSKESAINFASPVTVGDYLYAPGPNKKLVCVEARTGKQMWANTEHGAKAYAAILATAKIGISSVVQPKGHEGESVPLILMLHDAPNAAMRRALAKIAKLTAVKARPVMFRVEQLV